MDLAGFAESQSTYQKVEHALMYFYKSQIPSVTEDSEKSIKCLNEAIRLKPNFFVCLCVFNKSFFDDKDLTI